MREFVVVVITLFGVDICRVVVGLTFFIILGTRSEVLFSFDDGIGLEPFTEIQFACFGMIENRFGISIDDDFSLADDIAAIGDREGFPFAMVGEQNRDSGLTQIFDDILNAVNGHRVNSREGLIQQNNFGIAG